MVISQQQIINDPFKPKYMELFQTQQYWVSLSTYLRELRDKQQKLSINQYLQLYNAETNTTIENFCVG